jgi:hypothetical protein
MVARAREGAVLSGHAMLHAFILILKATRSELEGAAHCLFLLGARES